MDIEEVVCNIDDVGEWSALVARPPLTYGSDAKFVEMTEDGRVRDEDLAGGYQVLLDVEDIRTLLSYADRKKMSRRSVAEFVIHYATVDAYPAWFDDLPAKD